MVLRISRSVSVQRVLPALLLSCALWAQESSTQRDNHKTSTSAGQDVGHGAGDIGKGAGKGALSAARGTGKAVGQLATLHPVHAATDVGKGAAGAGRNVSVGALKATGKILRGTGKALRHIF